MEKSETIRLVKENAKRQIRNGSVDELTDSFMKGVIAGLNYAEDTADEFLVSKFEQIAQFEKRLQERENK